MKQKTGWLMVVLCIMIVATFLLSHGIRANSTIVSITTKQSTSTASVTVTDATLTGKQISVLCYAPGAKSPWNDLEANKKYLLYMNQFTAQDTTTFSIKIRKELVSGLYTLVVSSEKGQTVNQFRFLPEEETPAPSDNPQNTEKPSQMTPVPTNKPEDKPGEVKPSASTKPEKKLSAPAQVKAKSTGKKKITVTWKKVKGAKGYQIFLAAKKAGKYTQKQVVSGSSKQSVVLKKLKSGKVYYVKVRAYNLSGKKKTAGNFSKATKVKVR